MTLRTAGIHHITAFVTDAQENVDFYAGVLGLRLVKKTINFDAPEKTARLLVDGMGFRAMGQEGSFARFQSMGELGNIVDVNVEPIKYGAGGAGTVHHIAWRAKDHQEHERWRQHMARLCP